jgi:hypothetical protein
LAAGTRCSGVSLCSQGLGRERGLDWVEVDEHGAPGGLQARFACAAVAALAGSVTVHEQAAHALDQQLRATQMLGGGLVFERFACCLQQILAAGDVDLAGAARMPHAGRLLLVRDIQDPERFVSFGDWESLDEVRAWKSSPEFRERMARVPQHVDEFRPAELALVATAEEGSASGAASSVHYRKDGIATFDGPTEKLFSYMSAGNHPLRRSRATASSASWTAS